MLALEVIQLSVSDVDKAIAFYTDQVGFALDVDYRPTADFRVVQLTPPGSACSIQLVESTDRIHNLCLVTDDLAADRDALIGRGVAVDPIRHKDSVHWIGGFAPGIDPEHRDYASFADFTDSDGNRWTLQERGFASRKGH
jgi:catechol 2,3-dioxygenase-like lactoylglutathione lyase family enzyme